MKKLYFYTLGLLLSISWPTHTAFGISLQDFRKQIFRPNNLPAGNTSNVSAEAKVIDILNYLINLILFASGSIAVLMLVYGGLRFIISVGNEEGREAAINTIRSALIGLLVVIIAYALVTNIINLIYRATS